MAGARRLLSDPDRACQLLTDSGQSVGGIARELGFSSQAYFARMFRKETGLSPSVWRASQLRRDQPGLAGARIVLAGGPFGE